jgi:hypothetical protein
MAKVYQGVRLDSIVRGQAWQKRERGALGSHLVRVMTVSDGWVMVRMKGCQPWTVFWKDLIVGFDRMPGFDTTPRSAIADRSQ